MTRVRFRRPSPALAVAVLALFVAMGGVGIAEEAVTSAVDRINGKRLKNKSVPGKKLKNKTITGRKVRPGTLKAAHFGVGELPTLVDAYSKAESDGKYQPKGNYQPAGDYLAANGKAADADKLDGKDSGEFLGAGAKAADSELLDGKDSAEFLGVSAKAADAELLDGKDSADFLGKTEKAADADRLDGLNSSGFMQGQAYHGSATMDEALLGTPALLFEIPNQVRVRGRCFNGAPSETHIELLYHGGWAAVYSQVDNVLPAVTEDVSDGDVDLFGGSSAPQRVELQLSRNSFLGGSNVVNITAFSYAVDGNTCRVSAVATARDDRVFFSL